MSDGYKLIANNKQARFEYFIEDEFEAGLALLGTEVKALRAGKASLQEAFCEFREGSLFVVQMHIPPYAFGNRNNHEALRARRLLLNKRELIKLDKAVAQKGYTIVPLKLYFKDGYAKLQIGIGRGKKLYDKRATIAERDVDRRMRRSGGRNADD